jgi:hypothetical protein
VVLDMKYQTEGFPLEIKIHALEGFVILFEFWCFQRVTDNASLSDTL